MRRYGDELRRTHGADAADPGRPQLGRGGGRAPSATICTWTTPRWARPRTWPRAWSSWPRPAAILLTADTLRLAEGYVHVKPLGPVAGERPGRAGGGLRADRRRARPARGCRRARGARPHPLRGRATRSWTLLRRALDQAGAGHGQVVALVGEPGVGKSRLVYEFVHSHRDAGLARARESTSVSYGKATPYLPVIDLLRAYFRSRIATTPATIRAKVTGQVLTLDEALQDASSPLLALLDAARGRRRFGRLDPAQRRRRTLDALKRLLLRESQEQPLLLVFEDLHWIDPETRPCSTASWSACPPPAAPALELPPGVSASAGAARATTRSSGSTRCRPRRAEDASPGPARATTRRWGRSQRLLIERTEGNPFFLEESVRTLVETGVLVGERGAYRLARPRRPSRSPPPCRRSWRRASTGCPPRTRPAADGGGHWHGGALGRCSRPLPSCPRTALTAAWPAAGRGVPLRDPALSRARVHLQACPHPRGRLRRACSQERRRALHARVVEADRAPPSRIAWPSTSRLAHHAFRGEVWAKALAYLRQTVPRRSPAERRHADGRRGEPGPSLVGGRTRARDHRGPARSGHRGRLRQLRPAGRLRLPARAGLSRARRVRPRDRVLPPHGRLPLGRPDPRAIRDGRLALRIHARVAGVVPGRAGAVHRGPRPRRGGLADGGGGRPRLQHHDRHLGARQPPRRPRTPRSGRARPRARAGHRALCWPGHPLAVGGRPPRGGVRALGTSRRRAFPARGRRRARHRLATRGRPRPQARRGRRKPI